MKSVAFAALVSVAAAISADELEFVNYAARYNKVYEDIQEYAIRLQQFIHWHKIINEHNATNGTNFNLGHNQFSDWTGAEYLAILGYVKAGSENEKSLVQDFDQVFDFNDSDLPSYVNWVEAGGVTPVKDQGRCGSCWAFSAIAALEGAYFVKHNELLSLSEQQLIDCNNIPYLFGDPNKGCHGGDMFIAFEYFEKSGNAMLESAYPYTSGASG